MLLYGVSQAGCPQLLARVSRRVVNVRDINNFLAWLSYEDLSGEDLCVLGTL